MALFAERGYDGVSIRDAAAAADVSASLVVHHFGSKAGLRAAVDSRAVALVTEVLGQAATAIGDEHAPASTGQMFATLLRGEGPVLAYLRRMLIEGGEAASELFTRLLDGTEAELEGMVVQGVVRPSSYPRWRAAFLLANDLSALVLEDLLTATLGESPLSEQGMARWTEVLMQTYREGVFIASPGSAPPATSEGES